MRFWDAWDVFGGVEKGLEFEFWQFCVDGWNFGIISRYSVSQVFEENLSLQFLNNTVHKWPKLRLNWLETSEYWIFILWPHSPRKHHPFPSYPIPNSSLILFNDNAKRKFLFFHVNASKSRLVIFHFMLFYSSSSSPWIVWCYPIISYMYVRTRISYITSKSSSSWYILIHC